MISMDNIQDIYEMLKRVPMIDIHTHIDVSHAAARGLHDVLLYHMVVSDLYSAGCPSSDRLDEYAGEEEINRRIEEAVTYLPHIINTSSYWCMKIILADLYDFSDELTSANWKNADRIIKEKNRDKNWQREIVRRANIAKLGTEYLRRNDGEMDDVFEYSLEWAFFTRRQWGIFDAPLIELEYAWNSEEPGLPLPVTMGTVPRGEKIIQTIEDVNTAMADYCKKIPFKQINNVASHWSTDIHYREVSQKEMEQALIKRRNAGPEEEEIFANYLQQCFLKYLDDCGEKVILQFSIGAEPLPFETGSKLENRTLFELAGIMEKYPNIHFQVFLSNEAQNQALCTIIRELQNVSAAGYWWHNFFPTIMRNVMSQRLDMLPLNKQIGFFSDAYCLDWSYAKSIMVRKQMAIVLGDKIEMKQYGMNQAEKIAKEILLVTPQKILGFKPNLELIMQGGSDL